MGRRGAGVNPDLRIDALKGSLCLVAGAEPGEFHTPPDPPVGYL